MTLLCKRWFQAIRDSCGLLLSNVNDISVMQWGGEEVTVQADVCIYTTFRQEGSVTTLACILYIAQASVTPSTHPHLECQTVWSVAAACCLPSLVVAAPAAGIDGSDD